MLFPFTSLAVVIVVLNDGARSVIESQPSVDVCASVTNDIQANIMETIQVIVDITQTTATGTCNLLMQHCMTAFNIAFTSRHVRVIPSLQLVLTMRFQSQMS